MNSFLETQPSIGNKLSKVWGTDKNWLKVEGYFKDYSLVQTHE